MWSEWRSPEGGTKLTFVELSTEPSALVADIYDGTPLIIDPQGWKAYLEGSPADARVLAKPNPMHGFERVPVASKVNSVNNDGPDMIETRETEQLTD